MNLSQFPVRPDKDVDVVTDFVKPDFDAPRTLWSTKVRCFPINNEQTLIVMQITNAQLKARVSAFGSGIAQLVPEDSTVLILLNDCIGALRFVWRILRKVQISVHSRVRYH